ncbi:putative oxysterol-binding protein [Endogone sp. FLAS-F59071]|nr:putative oxysterol-binding protein [Endogone sp. FLAS-F59071]|eukprot:RUS19829.1 putative oxysterol-binding protein [Endogone sp. FLAS-F59071]
MATKHSFDNSSLYANGTKTPPESIDSAISMHSYNSDYDARSTGQASIGQVMDKPSDHEAAIAEELAATERANSEDTSMTSKILMFLGVLKKFVGVKDIGTVRISLPSQLLEPIGNLEYWNYNDRPDYFACLADPDDPLERMLGVIRWWYSKDLKYVPYNSILGEQFYCHWDVTPPKFNPDGSIAEQIWTSDSKGDANQKASGKTVRVTCLNEQISHHPPVSAFFYDCEEKGVQVCGIDHITARFTGTSVKLGPGDENKGIYVTLRTRDNEEYLLTHPWASVNGWLKANLYVTVSEHCVITCPKTGLKAILEYKDEKWLGKARFAIEGKVFSYDPANDEITKLKHVPQNKVCATIDGSWRGQIKATYMDTKKESVLVDMNMIECIPKTVAPIEHQGEFESRKVWQSVTMAIHAKDYSRATKSKIAIEERQRQRAAERKTRGEDFEPVFFKVPVKNGKPELKVTGVEKVKGLAS